MHPKVTAANRLALPKRSPHQPHRALEGQGARRLRAQQNSNPGQIEAAAVGLHHKERRGHQHCAAAPLDEHEQAEAAVRLERRDAVP